MKGTALFSYTYPLRILILEAKLQAHSVMRNNLAILGYQPEVAATSEEMLHLAGKRSYDVILTDVRPDEMENVLVTRQGEEEGRRPLVIALTDPIRMEFRNSCLASGMDHYISKTADPRELKLQLKACSVLSGTNRPR
jgi:CheY-like chemotaxis protein